MWDKLSVVVPRELKFPYENNVITCPTDKITSIENNRQFSNLSNPDKLKENAASGQADNGDSIGKNTGKHSSKLYTPHVNLSSLLFYWNSESNSAELLEHWISSRGHNFGYDAEVIEQ